MIQIKATDTNEQIRHKLSNYLPAQHAPRITLAHFINLVAREIYWCEKACGCGHCHSDFAAQFDIDDAGATLKPDMQV